MPSWAMGSGEGLEAMREAQAQKKGAIVTPADPDPTRYRPKELRGYQIAKPHQVKGAKNPDDLPDPIMEGTGLQHPSTRSRSSDDRTVKNLGKMFEDMDAEKKEAQRKFQEKVGKEGLPEGAGDKGMTSKMWDSFMGRSDPGASSSSAGRRPEDIPKSPLKPAPPDLNIAQGLASQAQARGRERLMASTPEVFALHTPRTQPKKKNQSLNLRL